LILKALVRFGPLAVGLGVLAVGLLFGLTDWAWRLEGRPNESYPEIFFLGMVAPLGLLVSLCGWFWKRAVDKRSRPLFT
jgi:hypothetical protein